MSTLIARASAHPADRRTLADIAPPDASVEVRSALGWRGDDLYLGGLWVGEVMRWSAAPHSGEWRAWVLTASPGAHHGWFATREEARREVVDVALGAVSGRDFDGA